MKVGDAYFYYQTDHLGTPQKLTAGNGEVVWAAKYNSFGKATIEVETIENNLRFGGQYEDIETSLYYNYHRYYDPEIGRYLRVDPIGFGGGDENFYVYVLNNSLFWIDPFGLVKYVWDYSPGPEVFIKPIGYMFTMRFKFKQEYKKKMQFCKELYGNGNSDCQIKNSNYDACVDYYSIFKDYSDNYGYWNAIFNSVFWDTDKNFKRLKNKLRPVKYDPFYFWDGKKNLPKTALK